MQRLPSALPQVAQPQGEAWRLWIWKQTALQGLRTYVTWGKILIPLGSGFLRGTKVLLQRAAMRNK